MPRAKVSIRTLREQLAAMTRERDACRRAKEENDDRFMGERDEAREELKKALLEMDNLLAELEGYRLASAARAHASVQQMFADAPEAITDALHALACFGYVTREIVPPGEQSDEERLAGVTTERDAMKAVLLELLTAEIALEAWRPGDAEARDGLVRRLNNAWMSTVDVLGMAR